MDNDLPVLHMHGQEFWHQEAYIVANRLGLEKLKTAIEEALADGASQAAEMASDGEGYDLCVQFIDNPWNSEEWEKAALPYTGQDACEKRKDAVWPWDRNIRK